MGKKILKMILHLATWAHITILQPCFHTGLVLPYLNAISALGKNTKVHYNCIWSPVLYLVNIPCCSTVTVTAFALNTLFTLSSHSQMVWVKQPRDALEDWQICLLNGWNNQCWSFFNHMVSVFSFVLRWAVWRYFQNTIQKASSSKVKLDLWDQVQRGV